MTINDALTAMVKNDGKLAGSQLAYMRLAVADIWNEAVTADNLIADMCKATGSVGKVTKEFPNGKPNPQALKANGFAGTAEAARLLRKIEKHRDNEAVIAAVEGFLGVIQSQALFDEGKAADKRIVKALESDDEAKLERAEAAYLADYLALTYPDRPTSFSALRRALDKATTATGTASEQEASDDGDGDGDSGDAVTVLTVAELAQSFIARIGEADDATVEAVLTAIRDEMTRRSESDDEQRIAA